MNIFTLFIMVTAITGSVGGVMAAKSQACPSPLIAAAIGIVIGAIVYFVPFHLAAIAADIFPRKKGERYRQPHDFPIVFICLWVALLPTVAGVSAYWLVIRIW